MNMNFSVFACKGAHCSSQTITLDNGVPSTAPLNQYLINEGIPTSITVQSSDTTFTEYLRANSWWTLTGTTPALRPLLSNTKVESNGTAIIRPQHPGLAPPTTATPAPNATPNPTPTPEDGLKFDVQLKSNLTDESGFNADLFWKFPWDNKSFGVKTLNHVTSGTNIPAPVALFFPSNQHQHPHGGPKGYDYLNGNAYDGPSYIATPNWVYYYDNEWKNPWGFEVGYWLSRGEGSYSLGDVAKIFIGDDAHAAMTPVGAPNFNSRPTYLYAIPPVSAAYPDGTAKRVGAQFVRGLDVYVRVITHESAHILMRKAITDNGAVDSDNDRCPDDIEAASGLVVGRRDTPGWGGRYSTYGDGETIATMYEKDLLSPTDNDWANDGFNWKDFRATPPNRIQRTTSMLYSAFSGQWSKRRRLVRLRA